MVIINMTVFGDGDLIQYIDQLQRFSEVKEIKYSKLIQ